MLADKEPRIHIESDFDDDDEAYLERKNQRQLGEDIDFRIEKARKRKFTEDIINLAKRKIFMQRKLDKQGLNKMSGVFDEHGTPLIHEINYVDNNTLLKKKAFQYAYQNMLKGEVTDGYQTTNPKLEKHKTKQLGFVTETQGRPYSSRSG